MLAAANNRLENAEVLVGAGIDINYSGIIRGIYTLLESAPKEKYFRLIKKLIAAGANLKTLEALGLPILYKSKEKVFTDFLISEGADVNFKDRNRCTPLHLMALDDNLDCSLSLIVAGADVNKKNKEGETPLMRAAHCGKVQFTELLLENGADINAYDSLGRCALFNAAWTGSVEILQLLLKSGANVNKTHSRLKQYISLIAAASKGYEECVRILLQEGADVNISDNKGHTALMRSAHYGHNRCVKLLLEAGADVNFTSHSGAALSGAAMLYERSHQENKLPSTAAACVDQLIQAGADVNIVNSHNKSALMIAAFSNYLDCVKLLLKAGAEVRIQMNIDFNTLPIRNVFDISIIRLLYAAGETKDGINEGVVERLYGLDRFRFMHHRNRTNKDFMLLALQHLSDDDLSLCLKHICRRTIRKHLLQMRRVNLFVRIPHLGLPPSLARYLLNDLSVD